MSGQEPRVAAVVCTHLAERRPQLVAAVRSLERQTRVVDELLVIVDGPDQLTEATGEVLPGRDVRGLGESRGVAVARTHGAQLVDADVVVFLDDDAEADPDWLERLLEPLSEPDVIGVSGRSLPLFEGPRPGWLPEEFLWTVGCSYRGMPEERAVVRNVYGGCAALRRSTFLAVGGFDAETGHHSDSSAGGEEADYCLRATAETGGVFVFEPAAVIHHHVPVGRLTLRYYLRRCFAEGVVKARMADRLAHTTLAPERSFARSLPRAVLRSAGTPGERPRALGLLIATSAVLAGLLVGRLLPRRRTG